MKITVTRIENPVWITVMHLEGVLDGANSQNFIDEARELHDSGACDLLLDLGKLTFISSAGLAALHQVALLFQGKKHPGQDESWATYRWAAFNNLDPGRKTALNQHVKLVSPTRQVQEVLDMIGFRSLFEIYTDTHLATVSFAQASPAL